MEKLEILHTFAPLLGVEVLWKTVWKLFKKSKKELPSDQFIPLLGFYPKELKSVPPRDISTPMFMTAIFTIAKMWKNPTCPSTDKWIQKPQFMHTVECYLVLKIRKFCNMP